MKDRVGAVNQLRQKLPIEYALKVILEGGSMFKGLNVFHAAGRKVVDDRDLMTSFEQLFRKVGTDETSSTSDESAHPIIYSRNATSRDSQTWKAPRHFG